MKATTIGIPTIARPPSRRSMNGDLKQATDLVKEEGSLLVLSLLALIAGAIAGMVGAIFRVLLEQADRLRDLLIAWAHGQRTVVSCWYSLYVHQR
jgi:hypothetical protein